MISMFSLVRLLVYLIGRTGLGAPGGSIAGIRRSFGSIGALGAWETFRLFPLACLPTVYCGLGFAIDYLSYVNSDLLPEFVRMPAGVCQYFVEETGIPPAYHQGLCLQTHLVCPTQT